MRFYIFDLLHIISICARKKLAFPAKWVDLGAANTLFIPQNLLMMVALGLGEGVYFPRLV